jgi:hypothetical protein
MHSNTALPRNTLPGKHLSKRRCLNNAASRFTRQGHVRAKPSASTTSGGPTTATEDYVQLGNRSLMVSSIGVGTIAWGDPARVRSLPASRADAAPGTPALPLLGTQLAQCDGMQ